MTYTSFEYLPSPPLQCRLVGLTERRVHLLLVSFPPRWPHGQSSSASSSAAELDDTLRRDSLRFISVDGRPPPEPRIGRLGREGRFGRLGKDDTPGMLGRLGKKRESED